MRTVVDPAGRPGMAIGVDPARRSLTNTRAPAGRDCTLSPPAVAPESPIALAGKPGRVVFAFPPAERKLIVVDDRRAPRRQLQRAFFGRVTVTRYTNVIRSERQFAQRDRSFSPRLSIHQHIGISGRRSNQHAACRRAPNRARRGTRWRRSGSACSGCNGAMGATGAGLPAGLSAEALCAGCAEVEAPGAEPGRSTIVASTPEGVSVTDPAARQRKNHPTDSAAMIATARTATAIGHFLRPVSGSAASAASSSCDGCVDHGRFRGRGGD